jgi:hypothetical protein
VSSAATGGWENCMAGELICIADLFLNNLIEIVNFI